MTLSFPSYFVACPHGRPRCLFTSAILLLGVILAQPSWAMHVVFVSPGKLDEPFWRDADEGLQHAAASLGIELELLHAERDHLAQLSLLRDVAERPVEQRPDYLLVTADKQVLPGQLELARVLFEDQHDRAAQALFQRIRAQLPADARAEGVRTSVGRFLAALDQRQRWQGSINLGATWSDNLNQSSESDTCLLSADSGTCIVRRTLPEAISASGLDYEATLNRRVALSGHHGVYARALLYGYSYQDHSEYNESTLITNLGYSYRDARNHYSLAPSFEANRVGNEAMYSAWGARAEWLHTLSQRSAFKLEANYRDLRYREQVYRYNNGGNSALYFTTWHQLSPRWTLFGGLDVSERRTAESAYGYLQSGVRLGASMTLESGLRTSLFSSFRHREYNDFNALLGSRRRDDESSHTLIVSAPRWALLGFTPNLTLKHTRVRSNVNWLYSYQRTQLSLRMEKLF